VLLGCEPMLTNFIQANREEIIGRTRIRVGERAKPGMRETRIERGIPLFLDELIVKLATPSTPNDVIRASATTNGAEMSRRGFTIRQVVQGYGDVCQVVTEVAIERNAPISTEDFRALNDSLDRAITEAVSGFEAQRDVTRSAEGTERLGVLAHELRNHLYRAMLSYEMLKRGDAAINGGTGAVLGQSLSGLRMLIDRSLAEVRLAAGVRNEERVSIPALLEEIELIASFEASARGIELTMRGVEGAVDVTADKQILASAIGNLVQNACKFTRTDGHITIESRVKDGRVLISVADGCGGLPPGKTEAWLQPFERRGGDRTGLGLGLSIALRAVEVSRGALHVENRPDVGCVFTIDLPLAAPA
jgi:signal transduction histidine kinase